MFVFLKAHKHMHMMLLKLVKLELIRRTYFVLHFSKHSHENCVFHKTKITNTKTKTLNSKTSVSKSQTTQKKQ